jgi:protoporphyrin/coproporphyrin ferrochelatase
MEGKASFLSAGGGDFRYIPALNTRPMWITALADLVMENLSGWLPENWDPDAERDMLQTRHERAQKINPKK